MMRLVIAGLAAASFVACQRSSDDRHYDEAWKNFGDNPGAKLNEGSIVGENETSSPEETGSISPDRLVYKASYRGQMLVDSIKVIYDDMFRAPTPYDLESISMYNSLKPSIDKIVALPIHLTAEQSYGNEKGSLFRQSINAELDQAGQATVDLLKGDSASGIQEYNRVPSGHADCPEALVCIDHMKITPQRGTPKSFCFYDGKSGNSTAIPIGVSPGLRREQIEESLRKRRNRFGPYVVRRFDRVGIDCKSTILDPVHSTEVGIEIALERDPEVLQAMNETLEVDQPPIDFGIRVEVVRREKGAFVSHLALPFIDSTAGLQSRTMYYFNEEKAEMVKIVKTLRRPLNIKLGGYDFTSYTGFLVDVEFRFCQDHLVPDSVSTCK